MNIRSIDMQVMINAADQASKVNNQNKDQAYLVQHHINEETKQVIKQEQTSIQTSHRTVYNTIQDQERSKKHKRGPQNRTGRKGHKKKTENTERKNSRSIDIKI
ncbi:MAG TPA: hypothetical protein GXZ32_09060 [Clostridiales bacterium]|nr:hypothetical protein [Clostridiales bacterium]